MTEGATVYLSAFIDELVRSGVRNIVISPGSRSTPLAVLAAEHPEMRVWMNLDERSAGFFALGMARALRSPVALLCTSGTAAANYLPAVVEANLARVPLIVLTADRPHELRDVGAPQTIQQIGLYGDHVKWFMEMPIPEAAAHMVRHARMIAARSAAEAGERPAGPVHLNFPLREPLVPDLDHPLLYGAGCDHGQAFVRVASGRRLPDDSFIESLAQELAASSRIAVVCGPQDDPLFPESVVELAAALGCPVLADPLSQLRSGGHATELVVESYDAFLRDEETAASLVPDVIIRFGAMPVSKPLLQYMNRHAASRLIVVDEGGWRDPTLLAADMIHADAAALCRALTRALARIGKQQRQTAGERPDADQRNAAAREWLDRWLTINRVTKQVFEQEIGSMPGEGGALFEGRIVTELNRLLPPDTALVVGNSMPIRDLDTFYAANDRRIRIIGNRGANGIDGLVSTALGVSAAGERAVLVLGDLSFYHDMNGLLAAKMNGLSLTVIVVNNNGGGIFSFLPQASLPRHYETLFGTPHGLDYSHAAAMYGGRFDRVDTWDKFREAFGRAMREGGLNVIEVPTDRASNVDQHRHIWRRLSERLRDLGLNRR